ncbi:Fanconi anemia group J protein homolog isoform X2 [Homalodisca vitripennis]|nr:Fanconi anemia group J protein homolog isoform X2 [Homalodisca vitripennis]
MDKFKMDKSISPEKYNRPILYSLVSPKKCERPVESTESSPSHNKYTQDSPSKFCCKSVNTKLSDRPSGLSVDCTATACEPLSSQELSNLPSKEYLSRMVNNCDEIQSSSNVSHKIDFTSHGPVTPSMTASPDRHRRTSSTPLLSNLDPNTSKRSIKMDRTSIPSMTPGTSRTKGRGCIGGVKMPIAGVEVEFPFQPYPTQIYMMNQVLQAIKKAENCLLESPTGTGKTMALLSSCLAWQQQELKLVKQLELEALDKAFEDTETAINKGESNIKKTPMRRETGQQETKNNTPSVHPSSESSSDDDIFQAPKRTKRSLGSEEPKDTVTATKETGPSETCDIDIVKPIEHFSLIEKDYADPKKFRATQIFYGTRTHKQIAQVVDQLKRSPYAKDINMTILAARDHTCVNDMVRGKPNVTELCKAAIDPVMGVSCLYYGGSSKISNFESLSNYGLPIVYDIEDMVCVGKKRRVCPYFTLRNLVTQAGIIFCPYNYLIDPRIRSSMNVNLTKSIVIMDEAHNIEDICREAGSLLLKQSDLEEAMSECRDNIKKDRNPEEYKIIEDFLQSLYSWLDSLGPTVQYSDMNEAKTTMTGEDVVNRLHLSNVSQENFQIFQDNLEKIETTKAEQPDLNYGISGKIKLLCDDIVVVLNYLYNPKNISKYKAYLNREVGSNERKEQKKNEWFTKPSGRRGQSGREEERVWKYSLHLLCLSPNIVFSELLGARTIVLASGTLSPLDSFQAELAVKFPWVVKGRHVVPGQNLFASTVSSGPQRVDLKGVFENVNRYDYQDELGRTILETSKVVPHGVLCFFTSYSLMDRLQQRWTSTGLLEELSEVKEIFWEPRRKQDMNSVMDDFNARIKISTEFPNEEVGAIMFGVFRGKIAEGIDFSDDSARIVIAVGIPYQNRFVNETSLKIKFNDENKSLINGNRWYKIQAYR